MMSRDKMLSAQEYMKAWIACCGRFDLEDVCDRAGVLRELVFVRQALLEQLDDPGMFELEYDMYSEARSRETCSDWLKELTERYFS